MKLIQSQHGLSLLEVSLAMAIAGAVIVLSIRSYNNFDYAKSTQQVQFNVSQMLLAMGEYYRANCSIQNYGSSTTSPIPGTLVTTATPYVVPISSITSYLPANFINVQSKNPIIDNSAGTMSGYVLQFNLTSGTTNTVCSAAYCGSITTNALSSTLATLTWRAQIAIKVADTALVKQLAATLGADCISSTATSNGSTYVKPCESYSGTRTYGASDIYLVWERLPAYAAPELISSLWVSMPALKQFNLQYTHDQMYELTSGTYIDNGVTGSQQAYYVCGS